MRKSLIICPVGDHSLHPYWNIENREYDVCLIYYGDRDGYDGQSKYYRRAKGPKYHLIKDTLDTMPELMDYEFVWLPDDDLHFCQTDAIRLFEYMRDFSLWIAQPSIAGWYGVEMTLHQKGSLLRYTNWVEIMCPCFDSRSIKICKDVFKENKTGWSIETIWNVLLGHPKDRIAIIDDVVIVHTRPSASGDTYSGTKGAAEALEEASDVYSKWSLRTEMEKDIEHGTPVGGEVYCSVVYQQIKKSMEIGIPKSDRFWPPCDLLRSAIKETRSFGG